MTHYYCSLHAFIIILKASPASKSISHHSIYFWYQLLVLTTLGFTLTFPGFKADKPRQISPTFFPFYYRTNPSHSASLDYRCDIRPLFHFLNLFALKRNKKLTVSEILRKQNRIWTLQGDAKFFFFFLSIYTSILHGFQLSAVEQKVTHISPSFIHVSLS